MIANTVAVRIPLRDIAACRSPRALHRALFQAGVPIGYFINMGINQPVRDWLEHDLPRLLPPNWRITLDHQHNLLVISKI